MNPDWMSRLDVPTGCPDWMSRLDVPTGCHGSARRAMVTTDQQRKALGAFIRTQRELANLSLRRMAAIAEVSNPYLSQIERGLHEPSVHILRSIAQALNLSAETLLEHA